MKKKADILVFAHDRKLGRINFVDEKVTGNVSWKKKEII